MVLQTLDECRRNKMTEDYSRFHEALRLHDAIIDAWANYKPIDGEFYEIYSRKKSKIIPGCQFDYIDKGISPFTGILSENEIIKYPRKYEITAFLIFKLLHHINTTFTYPNPLCHEYDNYIDECSLIFRGDSREEFLRKMRAIPPEYSETVMAVVFMRHILSVHRITFNIQTPFVVKGIQYYPWKVFAERYADLIIKA